MPLELLYPFYFLYIFFQYYHPIVPPAPGHSSPPPRALPSCFNLARWQLPFTTRLCWVPVLLNPMNPISWFNDSSHSELFSSCSPIKGTWKEVNSLSRWPLEDSEFHSLTGSPMVAAGGFLLAHIPFSTSFSLILFPLSFSWSLPYIPFMKFCNNSLSVPSIQQTLLSWTFTFFIPGNASCFISFVILSPPFSLLHFWNAVGRILGSLRSPFLCALLSFPL